MKNQTKTARLIKMIPLLILLALFTACSVRYTDFSYQIRGCIESDESAIIKEGSTISITRVVNFSDIRFEKQENTIKMYYRTASPCKRFDITIMNLTRGTYALETYDIKLEDISFFELTNTTNITIS